MPRVPATQRANLFLEHRRVLEPRAKAFPVHHLRFSGNVELAAIRIFAEPDRRGASIILIYVNDEDRYLWIEIGMAPHPFEHLHVKYALVTYY